jgi:outer membrane immunogenic protein
MLRKSLIAATALIAGLGASQAFAQADFNGKYVGAVVGYTDGTFDTSNAPLQTAAGSSFFGTFGGSTANSAPRFGINGWEYGLTAGYNYQRGPWLAGVESDISYSRAEGDLTAADRPSAGTNRFTTQLGGDVDYTGTLRLRGGYVAGPVLLYGTAGAATSRVNFDRNYRNAGGAAIADDSGRHVMAFAYGGGAEYKVSDKWSVKAEYLFLDAGKEQFRTRYSDGSTGVATADFDRDLYRMGVNYRF